MKKHIKKIAIGVGIIGTVALVANLNVSVTPSTAEAVSTFQGSDLQKILLAEGFTISKTASTTEWNNAARGFKKGTGVGGNFTTADGKIVTVLDGVITSIK